MVAFRDTAVGIRSELGPEQADRQAMRLNSPRLFNVNLVVG